MQDGAECGENITGVCGHHSKTERMIGSLRPMQLCGEGQSRRLCDAGVSMQRKPHLILLIPFSVLPVGLLKLTESREKSTKVYRVNKCVKCK